VISAVTASSALDAAREAGPLLERGQTFLDINSVSPATKRSAARFVERGQAHFVEAAVMDAVARQRLKVAMLLGGSYAAEVAERLRSIGMNATALSNQIGVASAVKMCRSVVMEGLEALAVECLFVARQYGAEDRVLDLLAATYPGLSWNAQFPDYLISRVAEHGQRRAAEMREVAQALKDVGIEPAMALATQRQQWLVNAMAQKKIGFEPGKPFSWRSLADAIAPRPRRVRSQDAEKQSKKRFLLVSGNGLTVRSRRIRKITHRTGGDSYSLTLTVTECATD
jgi:3-hydroxyisobutyrate dehydrogenase-like beta-hydroxyacid dehydrogenase